VQLRIKAINWKHPLTLMLVSASLGAAAWFFTTLWGTIDRSDLRAAIENPKQGIGLIGSIQPMLDGQPVFCDTANFSLVLAHNQRGRTPIVVNSISVTTAPAAVGARPDPSCKVDVLSSRPNGIAERKTFIISLADSGLSARYIESPSKNGAWAVSSQNLLDGTGQKVLGVTLKPDEEPVSLNFRLMSSIGRPYRISLSIDYDAGGVRSLRTNSILISR
jgi:hypothetical protein